MQNPLLGIPNGVICSKKRPKTISGRVPPTEANVSADKTSVVSADKTSVVSADKTSVVSLCQQTSSKTSSPTFPPQGWLTQQMSCLQTQQMFCLQTHWLRSGAHGPKCFSAVSWNILLRLEYRVLDSAWFFSTQLWYFQPRGSNFEPRDLKLGLGAHIWARGPNLALGPLGPCAKELHWAP